MQIILLKDVEKRRPPRRGRRREARLCPQLPAAAAARRGRRPRPRRRDRADRRRNVRGTRPGRPIRRGEIAELLGKTVLRFEVKAGPTGALFGSVTPTDIADEIWRARKIRVDRRKIGIETIKRIGRYTVPIDVYEGVVAEVKTLVVPEGGELPPEEELAAMEAAEQAEAAAAAAASPQSTSRPRSPPSRRARRAVAEDALEPLAVDDADPRATADESLQRSTRRRELTRPGGSDSRPVSFPTAALVRCGTRGISRETPRSERRFRPHDSSPACGDRCGWCPARVLSMGEQMFAC